MTLEEKIEWRRYRKTTMLTTTRNTRFEVMFGDGIPDSDERRNHDETFIYPEELIDKKCGGCVRCEARDRGSKVGWHCMMRNYDIDVSPDHKACVAYWDRAEMERAENKHESDVQRRREELWAIYAVRDPVKLPFENDGYGVAPFCPVCGEMPYDTEQCYWCGQRFVQDEETVEYATPKTVPFTCPGCGKPGEATVAKYNGHKHFCCNYCGLAFME